MRRRLFVALALVGLGLVLLFVLSQEGSGTEGNLEEATTAREKAPAGTVLQPESPEDVGARGNAAAGSTPTLAQTPSQADGFLEVEVLASEKPVPGASVRLYWRGAKDPSLGEVSWRLASTGITDAKGRARLASRPGGYLVAVHAQGYAPLRRDVVRPYGEARTSLRLTLAPGQTLTGRTVVHGTNEPLPMVELVFMVHGRELEPWQKAEAPAEERVYATSDEWGNFRVDGLAPGNYQLEAQATGYARAVMNPVKLPAAEPLTVALRMASVIEGFVVDAQGRPAAGAEVQVSGRSPQVVTTGEGGGFSAEVESGSHTVSARRGDEAGALDAPVIVSAGMTVRDVRVQLGQGAVLEGRVVARTSGAPVPGASINVSPRGDNGDSGRAVSDSEGHFSVRALAPGSYDVAVSAPGFSPTTRRGLTVATGERFPVDIQLTGAGSVEGHVRDGAGRPVPGALVVGGSRWGGGLGTSTAESRTDAEGYYRLEGLATGRMNLTARREGATTGVNQPVEVTEDSTAQADFTLDEVGTLEGVVRAASGPLPSEPMQVMAFSAQAQGQSRFGSLDVGRAEVDANGDFRMTLPAGPYGVHVTSTRPRASAHALPKQVQVEAGRTTRVELTLEQQEQNKTEVRGIVLEPDGTPSPRALVTVSSSGGPRGTRSMAPTDEEGRFTLSIPRQTDASAANVIVSAQNGGRIGEVTGVRAGEREVVVKLRSGASLRGRVVHANGTPVRGFTVSIRYQRRGSYNGNNTQEFPGDRFELRDVPLEPVRLVVWTVDGAKGEATATPTPNAPNEVVVTLKVTASIRGRVVDAASKAPLANALAFIEDQQNPPASEGTATDGRFFLKGMNAGDYTLVIFGGPSRGRETRQVKLVAGQELDVGDIPIGPPR